MTPGKTPSSWNAASSLDPLAPLEGASAVAVVLGSGLADVSDLAGVTHRVPYRHIPSLFKPSVEGHPGVLALADFNGRPALLFAGRSHVYEGPPAVRASAAVSLAADLGCTEIVLTCAAGGFTPSIPPGTWLVAEDVLPFPTRLAAAFIVGGEPEMDRASVSALVSPRLRRALRRSAIETGAAVASGVLAWMSGPCYETAAEARAAREAGADAATMSIYPELVAARRRGIDAAVLSWITNYSADVAGGPVDHAEVMRRGGEGGRLLAGIIDRFLASRDGR